MKKRAVIYARVSSKEQEDNNYSLPSQIEAAKQYAQQHGMEVIAIYREDVSGLKYPRPKLEKALEMMENGEADALIAHADDRLNRHEINGFLIRKRIGDAGAELHYTLSGQYELGDDDTLAMIKDLFAAREVRTMQERLHRGKRYKAKSGTWPGLGTPAYGYRRIGSGRDSAFEINEDEAQWVRKIFEWYAVEGISVLQIIRRLHTYGVQRPGMTRAHASDSHALAWDDSSVYKILKRETYAGRYYYNRHTETRDARGKRVNGERPREEWIEVAVPAIIDEGLFKKAEARLLNGKNLSSRNRKYEYLMSSRVTCGVCGRAMSPASLAHGKYRYYRCYSYRRDEPGRKKCSLPLFHAQVVDDVIWGCVRRVLQNPEALRLSIEEAQEAAHRDNSHIHESIGALEAEIRKQETRLARAVELYLESDGYTRQLAKRSQEECEDMLRRLHKERAELGQQVAQSEISAEALGAVEEHIAELREDLDTLEIDDQRALVAALGGSVRLVIEEGEKIAYLTILLQTYRVEVGPNVETEFLGSRSHKDCLKKSAVIPLTFRLVLAA